jgi:hypothetical protein
VKVKRLTIFLAICLFNVDVVGKKISNEEIFYNIQQNLVRNEWFRAERMILNVNGMDVSINWNDI